MMDTVAAYLVDLDGTLADTAEANYQAYALALREAGVDIDRTTFDRRAFGRNWRQFLPELLAEAGAAAEPAAIARRKAVLYGETAGAVRFNEALVALLASRAPGVRVALVTTASRANVAAVLSRRADVKGLFDDVITGDDVVRHKPDPEAYHLAAGRLGVAPGRCVVFEDSDIGVAAGEAFGARVLRVVFKPA